MNAIAAQPGFSTLDHWIDADGKIDFVKLPIIAWWIDEDDGFYIPICLRFGKHETVMPIETPDGTVILGGENDWPNIAAWIEYLQTVDGGRL